VHQKVTHFEIRQESERFEHGFTLGRIAVGTERSNISADGRDTILRPLPQVDFNTTMTVSIR
jgi:hypothetical protein